MPQTPIRGIRIPTPEWEAAKAKAAQEGTSVSEIVRIMLQIWVGGKPRQ